jgi:hypothetical protein
VNIAGLACRPPDLERRLRIIRNELGYRRLTVEHRERPPATHTTQVPAQMGLEICYAHATYPLTHDLIMVMTGHVVKSSEPRWPTGLGPTTAR